ncbi:uncharacterized protein LOC105431352 [Pogonomyrmex barbatus]|uniref:Uncharacterized protein LOC105431352 n=1 Tax=Pogonomyrmex barbatus TaxID=144034 RepID=A0A6I9WVB5_9HYME|nr:uncharacterized protein LOC105431352 [Pogonomyrmex barbatus]
MQGLHRLFVITILVVLLIIHSGDAIKCYKCTSETSKTCEKAPTKNETEECYDPVLKNNCITYEYDVKNTTAIGRRCFIAGQCKSIFKKCIHECSTDLCNASTSNTVSIVTIIVSGLITLLWKIQ